MCVHPRRHLSRAPSCGPGLRPRKWRATNVSASQPHSALVPRESIVGLLCLSSASRDGALPRSSQRIISGLAHGTPPDAAATGRRLRSRTQASAPPSSPTFGARSLMLPHLRWARASHPHPCLRRGAFRFRRGASFGGDCPQAGRGRATRARPDGRTGDSVTIILFPPVANRRHGLKQLYSCRRLSDKR